MTSKNKPAVKVEAVEVEVPEVAPEDFVPCCGKDECLDCPYDEPEVVEASAPALEPVVEAPRASGLYIVKEGDSWPSIAADNLPAGRRKHDYATELISKNGSSTLRPGMEIKL